MNETDEPGKVRSMGLRGIVDKAGAPVLAQAVTAGTSLLLQVLALGVLGLADYGAFALMLALLVTAVALHAGFVGDSLAVLDRHEPRCRASLVTGSIACAVLFPAAAVVLALALRPESPLLAAGYATLVMCRLVAETVRRLLIARLEFRLLLVCDCWNPLVSVVVLVLLWLAPGTMGLGALVAAMATGALAVAGVGLVRLPAHELRSLRPGTAGMRRLVSFAGWRSLQAALRPATLLLARVLVANVLSLAAVGLLEAARLVVAPLQVVINGTGSLLLGKLAARQRGEGGGDPSVVGLAARLLTCFTVLGGAVLTGAVLVLSVWVLPWTGWAGTVPEPVLILGWVAYLGVWAAGLPYVTEMAARRMSRTAFTVRVADSSAGLCLAAVALASGAGVWSVPAAMSVAGLYTVYRLRAFVATSRVAAEAGGQF